MKSVLFSQEGHDFFPPNEQTLFPNLETQVVPRLIVNARLTVEEKAADGLRRFLLHKEFGGQYFKLFSLSANSSGLFSILMESQ